MSFHSLLGVLALAAGPGTLILRAGVDAQLACSRMEAEVLLQAPEQGRARRLIRSQRPDGSWPDVPYDRRDRSLWPPNDHLHRLLILALAARDKALPPDDRAAMRDAAERGLAFWVLRNPRSDNWWWNTIGMQQALTPVLVLLRDDLSEREPATWQGACGMLGRSHVDGMTGANLVWEAKNLFTLAALTGNEPFMAAMSRRVAEEVRVTTAEGIQPDFSFHQHGPQLNAGNYGLSFVPTACRFALLVQGTRMQWPEDKIALLDKFESGFQEWVVWGRYLDLSSCGRQIDQPGEQTGKAADIAEAGGLLGRLIPSEAGHWARFQDRVRGLLPPAAGGPRGDRYYWRSDFLVHRPGGWYASVKMYSPRVRRTETEVNSENFRGYHLCDGMTSFLVRGDEYENIQPVWDWRKLPGVTFKATRAPFPYGPKAGAKFNPCPFVGGASDGEDGVAAMDIAKEDLRAEKSWFCFREGVVCLGTGIACASPETVTTDINQCLLRGTAMLYDGRSWTRAASGSPAPRELGPDIRAVWHDGIGYARLSPARWDLAAGPQTGSWALLRKERASREPVVRTVFDLWIDHGSRPADGSYAYAVLPEADPQRVERFVRRPAYRVLENDGALQAVADEDSGIVEAVLRKPGAVPAAAGLPSFSADKPCVVILRKEGGRTTFYVADPTQTLQQVILTPANGDPLTARLPREGRAGSTVRVQAAGSIFLSASFIRPAAGGGA